MSAALMDDDTSDACVSCSSDSIENVAEQVYRCRACGHEGGPGWARLRQQAKLDQIATMDPAARRQRAQACLIDADRSLAVGVSSLEQASRSSVHDMVGLNIGEGFGAGEGAEKFTLFSTGVSRVIEARAAVIEAEQYLDVPLGLTAKEANGPGHLLTQADLWLDGIAFDAMTHARIEDAIHQARELQEAVRRALARHFGPAGLGFPHRT